MTVHSDDLDAELLNKMGEVSYIAAFDATFVSHTEDEARAVAKKFTTGDSAVAVGHRPVFIYRIEVIDVVVGDPAPLSEVHHA